MKSGQPGPEGELAGTSRVLRASVTVMERARRCLIVPEREEQPEQAEPFGYSEDLGFD